MKDAVERLAILYFKGTLSVQHRIVRVTAWLSLGDDWLSPAPLYVYLGCVLFFDVLVSLSHISYRRSACIVAIPICV
jgi:hypothetical protein